jgi:nicotinamidase-related amidase
MRALVVIDYTNDFVADDGKLTCGTPGQVIEGRIIELVRDFVAAGDLVVMAVDLHHLNEIGHPENKLFPPHNIEGTEGRELYGQLASVYEEFKEKILWMDKTRYSAFHKTELQAVLLDRQISEVHLVGVCTDICVLHTAVDAYNKDFNVTVHADAVASFNQAGHEWALGHFKHSLGFTLR